MSAARDDLSTQADLGDLLFVGFDGVELTLELRVFLEEVRPGGIILFKRNVSSPEQVVRLIAAIKRLYDPAPIIAVDEEGGQVSRLRPMAPTLPPAARLAAGGDPGAVRRLAAAEGSVLASLGFDLDFAPVVDLCRPDAPNGIGDRSFGTDAEQVCVMASAYLEGLADAGITGCLKHFPGLGPTLFDSHHHLPTVQKDKEAFLRDDLLPYRRLQARVPLVMIGHGHYPFLAGEVPIAATLANTISTDLLRGTIGFPGLALADDLEMKAVSARVSYDELAPRVIAAGSDMALVCRQRDAVLKSREALRRWAEDGRLDAGRVREARARLAALRRSVAVCRERAVESSVEAFREACAELGSGIESLA